MKIIRLRTLLEDRVLAGRAKGELHLPRLLPQMEAGGVVALDFDGVEVLTTSYFFAALWPLWTREDAAGPSTFPLVVNACPAVQEEVTFIMQHRKAATWYGRLADGQFECAGYLGVVDDGVGKALAQAIEGHELSAVELAQRDGTNATTWNNRLASALRQRLLRRQRSGRRKTFSTPWKEQFDG